jgi:lysophospholipase L1-like esterase/pimeloyl-ACP methyl ester carboxylesterase
MLHALLLTSLALPTIKGSELSHLEDAPLKVACIGDSITYGSKVAAREKNHYPAQLGYILGDGFEVRNFGVGGSTLLGAADQPFVGTTSWEEVLAWNPDTVIIVLGTNDTCQNAQRPNWDHAADLEGDARAMVQALREDSPGTRILLCSPPPMFSDASGLNPERRADLAERAPRLEQIGQALQRVARGKKAIEYHDLARVFTANETVDGVHTSPFGARALAQRLAEAILAKRGKDLPSTGKTVLGAELETSLLNLSTSDYHGFERMDFNLPQSGAACILVAPHEGLRGRPWLWRMRFFGHEPALELELLDRGMYLAYVDVAGLYGSPEALRRMTEFYDLLRQKDGPRLSGRPVLMGMSRGGLPALHWATVNPKKISGLYVDNGVFDLSTWPGGKDGQRREAEWAEALEAWGWGEEEGMRLGGQLIAKSQRPAREGVPLFVAVGLADEVVPPSRNSQRLALAWERRGGPVYHWPKPGAKHHPHGVHPPASLRRSILNTLGHSAIPTVRAVPSAEYRGSAAGWGGGTWWDELAKLQALGREHPETTVVFLGDSITQSLSGAGDRVAHEGGTGPFHRNFGPCKAVNLGVSGDRTEHVLYRIEHGALAFMDPKVIVLQIGVNNVAAAGHTARETVAGIQAVVASLREREPQAKIVICGPFPAGATPDDPRRICINAIHEQIKFLTTDGSVLYVDLRTMFLDVRRISNGNMAGDALHISPAGKEAWLSVLYFSVMDMLSR